MKRGDYYIGISSIIITIIWTNRIDIPNIEYFFQNDPIRFLFWISIVGIIMGIYMNIKNVDE